MKEIDYLSKFEEFLTDIQMDTAILEATEEVPYDRLLIYAGADYKNRERILEITLQIQQLGQNVTSSVEREYIRTQFQVTLPFKIELTATQDTASLLHFLNKLLELPGWEMNEVEDSIDYRYVLLAQQDGLDQKLFGGVVGIILMFLQLFTEVIEQVASGKRSFNDLLEEIIRISNQTKV